MPGFPDRVKINEFFRMMNHVLPWRDHELPW
jgi:hypothetical protein